MTSSATTTAAMLAKQMRANIVTKYGSNFSQTMQYVEDAAMPVQSKEQLKPSQVLVQIKNAAINPVDYKVVEGKFTKMGFAISKFPAIMGKDFCGIVVAKGKGVNRVQEGDEVFGWSSDLRFGAFAEYGVFEEKEMAKKPSSLSMEASAASPLVFSTAFQALLTHPALAAIWKEKESADNMIKAFSKEKLDQVTKNMSILITGGSGGTGSFLVLLAKHFFQFSTVYSNCSTKNVEYVQSLGADTVIDYTKQKVEDVIKTKIDFVVDTVCSEDSMKYCFGVLKDSSKNGTYTSITTPDTVEGGLLNLMGFGATVAWKMLRGKTGHGPNTNVMMAKANATQLEIFSKWAEDEAVQKLVSLIPITTFGLKDVPKAFEQTKTKRTVGKNVIVI